jgi:hypothetical protein
VREEWLNYLRNISGLTLTKVFSNIQGYIIFRKNVAMTFDTIPIPKINFADVPEKEAEDIVNLYFESDFNIYYLLSTPKDHIKKILWAQESNADRIVILAYLINKLTIKLFNLPKPLNDFQKDVQESGAKATYKTMLHWLYRLIENEGIAIPTDLFSEEEYETTNQILLNISTTLDDGKEQYPGSVEIINQTQNKIIETKKFLWLGKEKYMEMLMGTLFKLAIEKELMPLFVQILLMIKNSFLQLLN